MNTLLTRAPRCLAAFASLALCASLSGCETHGDSFCDGEAMTGNNKVPPSFEMELGRNGGTFDFYYETRKAQDRIQVFYEGKELYDSGCVSEAGKSVKLRYGPGRTSHVDVKVSPNCDGGPMTSWMFKASCPTPLVRGNRPRPKTSKNANQPQRQ